MNADVSTSVGQGNVLADAPTCELQWELERREGITAFRLGLDAIVEVTVDGVRRYSGRGPLTLTVNQD